MIEDPYLLVLNIELRWHEGDFWAEPLWHQDLIRHLDTIVRLTLFCPVRRSAPPPGWRACRHSRLRIAACPPLGRLAPLRVPVLAARLFGAIGEAQIVHTGVAGWPFPLGWLAAPIARLRGRFLMIVVESSFWRVAPGTASPWRRWKARIIEAVNRACVNACDLSLFTTEAYRRELATHPRGRTAIAPASWLEEHQLLARDEAAAVVEQRNGRLLYAGRLVEEKGVRILLEAARLCEARIDIVGTGPLADACAAVAAAMPDRVRLIEPVAYGPAFSALIERYEALVVPSLSDEQPRVIFDAFARGLPIIASATPGHLGLVKDGETGRLVPPGDARALATAMEETVRHVAETRQLGLRALATVGTRTHAAMHRDRAAAITAALGERH